MYVKDEIVFRYPSFSVISKTSNLPSRLQIYFVLYVAFVCSMYSALQVDMETIGCL